MLQAKDTNNDTVITTITLNRKMLSTSKQNAVINTKKVINTLFVQYKRCGVIFQLFKNSKIED